MTKSSLLQLEEVSVQFLHESKHLFQYFIHCFYIFYASEHEGPVKK